VKLILRQLTEITGEFALEESTVAELKGLSGMYPLSAVCRQASP